MRHRIVNTAFIIPNFGPPSDPPGRNLPGLKIFPLVWVSLYKSVKCQLSALFRIGLAFLKNKIKLIFFIYRGDFKHPV
jgi:hypothetical protein